MDRWTQALAGVLVAALGSTKYEASVDLLIRDQNLGTLLQDKSIVGQRPGITADTVVELAELNKVTEAAATELDGQFSDEDIANAVAFLASDQASYITGETMSLTGGLWND